MKENVLDVLMYLFEHYLDDDTDVESDQESLKHQLVHAGFPEAEISKAFAWLEGLAVDQELSSGDAVRSNTSTRVFTADEMGRMDRDCRGFLLFLEQAGVLDSKTRELVIDRVMALETESIDLEHLKWVILMVLFNQPGKEEMFAWMEDFVFDKGSGTLH
jgi:Smg protein